MRNLPEGDERNADMTMDQIYPKEVIDHIEEACIQSLREAKIVHDELGEEGLTPVPSPNQFNERALKADVEAERVVLNSMGKSFRESGLVNEAVITSEEYGITNLIKNQIPDSGKRIILRGYLDGMDGSSQLLKGMGILRYATILSIAAGDNPKYRDYLLSFAMEHSTNRLWVGIKGEGSFLIDANGKRTRINSSSRTLFDQSTRIYSMSPDYNDIARQYFTTLVRDFNTKLPLSEAIALADVATGEADIAVEVTRKGNLEQMGLFGLIAEAGGVMVDVSGRSIANQSYSEWGQKESLLLVTAATSELARDFLEKLKLLQ